MRKIAADYIFPITSEPIEKGVVIINDHGEILGLLQSADGIDDVETYEGILCPGFINAHCHLELSYLKNKVAPGCGLPDFIKQLNEVRWEVEKEIVQEAIVSAEKEMIANGVVGVGDICNGNSTFLQKSKGNLHYHNFIELFGVDPAKAKENFHTGLALKKEGEEKELSCSITPHSPYSLSEELLKKIGGHNKATNGLLSIHNQESQAENEMFVHGRGGLISLFEEYFKLDMSQWEPKGSSLAATLKYLPKNNKLLLVHNTYTTQEDMDWGNNYNPNIYWCLCPNANLYIENTLPNITMLAQMKDNVCIGTDSLASNHQLSVLDELKTISAHFSEIALGEILQWATLNGATYFGWENELGSFDKGKQPGINLISGVDKKNLQLTKESTVQKLI